jgi:hypothetical protein
MPATHDLTMDDYLNLGVMDALQVPSVSSSDKPGPVHAMGYCLGGTLLSIAAAAMARIWTARRHGLRRPAATEDPHIAGSANGFFRAWRVGPVHRRKPDRAAGQHHAVAKVT